MGVLCLSCSESLIGREEILCGFVHEYANGILVLKAEIHIEYTEIFIYHLYSDKELLLFHPTAGCGTLVVVTRRKFRAHQIGVPLFGK